LNSGSKSLYEHNPRRANNAKFDEIKESIRSTGIRNPLTVTRRPGEKHFIVEAGGNTRLLAIQQLWEETRDPRFEKLAALFRPWRSEAHVLSAHLIENEQRGEMTFWDKANGVFALKAQLEAEKGRALSVRQLEEELKAIGFSVNTATLTHYIYTTTRLRILGDAVPVLSGLDAKTIQPRLNLMKRYAQMRDGTGEADLYAGVFDPVFRRHADQYQENQSFNASNLCHACEEALAQHLGENVTRLRMVLDALAQSPQASLEALSQTVGSALLNVPALRTCVGSQVPDGSSAVSSANAPPGGIERCAVPRTAARMPNSSHTDLAALNRLKQSIARFATLASDVPTVNQLDAEFFGWLLDGRDEVAATFWEIVDLARTAQCDAAAHRGPEQPMPPRERRCCRYEHTRPILLNPKR
jgi:ParB family protein of integrating conjugative element (PFGI_1 class)